MSRNLLATAMASVLALTAHAHATIISRVDIHSLGTPTCAATNREPDITNGMFYPSLMGDEDGVVSPWSGTTFAQTGPYVASVGSPGGPSTATYRLRGTSVTALWGALQPYAEVYFLKNRGIIGRVNGADLAALYPNQNSLYVSLRPVVGAFDEVRFSSQGNAFPWNLNPSCK